MKRIQALLTILVLCTGSAARADVADIVIDGKQEAERVTVRGQVERTRYEDREVPSTCYRREIVRYEQQCHTEYENECETQYRQECRNVDRRECTPTTRQVCENEPRRECTPVQRCENVTRRECTPTSRQVCEDETRRHCRTETRRECSNERVCRQVQDEICRTDPRGARVCTPIVRQVCENEERCRNVPHQVCENTTERVCRQVPDQVCRNVTENVCRTDTVCRDTYERVCRYVPDEVCRTVTDRVCEQVPYQECRQVPRTRCETVPVYDDVPYACTRTERVPVGTEIDYHTEADVTVNIQGIQPGMVLNEKVQLDLTGEDLTVKSVSSSGKVLIIADKAVEAVPGTYDPKQFTGTVNLRLIETSLVTSALATKPVIVGVDAQKVDVRLGQVGLPGAMAFRLNLRTPDESEVVFKGDLPREAIGLSQIANGTLLSVYLDQLELGAEVRTGAKYTLGVAVSLDKSFLDALINADVIPAAQRMISVTGPVIAK